MTLLLVNRFLPPIDGQNSTEYTKLNLCLIIGYKIMTTGAIGTVRGLLYSPLSKKKWPILILQYRVLYLICIHSTSVGVNNDVQY
ncbi:hypothetical protein DOY81_001773 [Sarcophaga bullata]|nr:hypothetical protein DOY81_001773 [Sarcophaga bullata]